MRDGESYRQGKTFVSHQAIVRERETRTYDLIASASSKNNAGFGIVSSVRCSSSSNQQSKIGKRPSPWTGPKPKMSDLKMGSITVESSISDSDGTEGVVDPWPSAQGCEGEDVRQCELSSL